MIPGWGTKILHDVQHGQKKKKKNSPTIFGEILAKDLRDPQLIEGALMQCVDDILIASKTKDTSGQNTVLTLNFWLNEAIMCPRKRHKFSALCQIFGF